MPAYSGTYAHFDVHFVSESFSGQVVEEEGSRRYLLVPRYHFSVYRLMISGTANLVVEEPGKATARLLFRIFNPVLDSVFALVPLVHRRTNISDTPCKTYSAHLKGSLRVLDKECK